MNRPHPCPDQMGAVAGQRRQRPIRARSSVPITLQSTAGGFSADFIARLPRLETAMRAHGLDPSAFVIAKDHAASATVRPLGPFFYDYTVFIDDTHFTVTEPNDARFMDYLLARCAAADSDPLTPDHEAQHKADSLLSRLLRWMERPI